MDEDRGARRNRNENGLWLINALLSAVVLLLSLYVFRAPDHPPGVDVGLQVAEHRTGGY
ncbi:hypothetical protein [Brevundimonas sp.]|jgi:hypothetical protein|uniref:hypothetical protein n=1 Tax=Brevundimonas sp. TaxID=1871086 RepID=UPI002ED9C177